MPDANFFLGVYTRRLLKCSLTRNADPPQCLLPYLPSPPRHHHGSTCQQDHWIEDASLLFPSLYCGMSMKGVQGACMSHSCLVLKTITVKIAVITFPQFASLHCWVHFIHQGHYCQVFDQGWRHAARWSLVGLWLVGPQTLNSHCDCYLIILIYGNSFILLILMMV